MRLLIVADAAAASYEQVPESVRGLIESADELLVVAPELPSRGHWLVSDADKARMAADERIGIVIGHLEDAGHAAPGEIGADDPLLAFEDAIREFDPDHILIGLRVAEHAAWQEHGLLDHLLERFGLPITAFMV